MQVATDLVQHPVHAVGVGIVEEVDVHGVVRTGQGRSHELGPQGRTADADAEDAGEALGLLGAQPPIVDPGGKLLDSLESGLDLCADLGGGGQFWRPQPVVAHHAALVGVGLGPTLQVLHGLQGLAQGSLHLLQEGPVQVHPADVHGQAGVGIFVEHLLETLPVAGLDFSHRVGPLVN